MKQLPYSGGIMQQPEKLMTCIDIVRQTHDKFKMKEMEREARLNKVKAEAKRKHGK